MKTPAYLKEKPLHETVCTVIGWPVTGRAAVTSLFLTSRPYSSVGRTDIQRRLGALPVAVDGQTAWWVIGTPVTTPGEPIPASDHFLLAAKDGRLIGVQVTSLKAAESTAREAMSKILPVI